MKKKNAWVYTEPYVHVPYFLMESDVWWDLSGSAVKLYLAMRKSYKDISNGYRNSKSEAMISFGPSDIPYLHEDTYYRALDELLSVGLVREVSPGGHGIKAVYDLLTLDWMDHKSKRKERWQKRLNHRFR